MKKILSVFLILALCVAIAPNAFAGSKEDWEAKLTSDNYGERFGARALHGVVNIGLGWTQLFVEPYNSMKYEDQNFIDGFFDGMAKSVYYTVIGGWELGTSWVPGEKGKNMAVMDCVTTTFDYDKYHS